MATLFFGVQGPTLDFRTDLNVADNDAPRIIAMLMASSYGKVTENVSTDVPDASWTPGEGETEDDRPSIATQAWVTRAATPEETTQAYARALLDRLLAETVAHEKAEAARLAAEAVQPIAIV